MFTDGRYEQLLILTFGADLEFYERVLRRHFGHYRNQIVLADGRQLDRTISAGVQSLKHLNRSWLAGPIRTLHTAHAKAILLAGPEAGLLLVGSGNLNSSGYAGAGECFTPYRWSPDQPDDLAAFTRLRDLTDGLNRRGCLDTITSQRLAVFWSAYDWWHTTPTVDGPVRHNLEIPLGDQFVAAVGDEHVQRLTVLAPFHDPHCAALNRLVQRLRPQDLRVLVQPGHCSIDSHQLNTVLSAHNGHAYAVTTADDHDSYLHAKIITAVTEQRAICLTGSANSSMVALWSPYPNANIELGNLTSGAPDAFDHLLDPGVVRISGPVDINALGVSIRDDDIDPAEHAIACRNCVGQHR
ncbi:MAG: hypothetical protein HC872_06985 [Gammaproteobacteria bacterium]|nr:hypothetical protein [Gammaproteobacteria bacterium]